MTKEEKKAAAKAARDAKKKVRVFLFPFPPARAQKPQTHTHVIQSIYSIRIKTQP